MLCRMVEVVAQRRWIPRLKVLYLIAISVVVYLAPMLAVTRPYRWIIVPSLLFLQAAVLASRVPLYDVIRPITRLKWLFAFLGVCYLLLPGGSEDVVSNWQPIASFRPIPLNIAGLETAALMCT